MRGVSGWIVGVACVVLVVTGCGKSSYEQGKELFDQGAYEQALPLLEAAKKDNDHFIQVEEMIRQSKVKMVEQADKDCERRAENYQEMLAQAKTVDTWDRVMAELKTFSCRKVVPKPYIDAAYFRFISYLAEWDAYPQAVSKYCEFTGCEAAEARVLVREEEVIITDENNKEKKEIIQQEIPIAQHEIVMEMFKWLAGKDPKNGRWFDRYAKFLYDNERYKDALEAYEAIAKIETLGYEVKSRAQLAAEHLRKGGRRARQPGEEVSFFWIEEVKTKSKLKALKRELEAARKELEEAEGKERAVDGAAKP